MACGTETEAGSWPPGAKRQHFMVGPVRVLVATNSPELAGLIRQRFRLLRGRRTAERPSQSLSIDLRECPDGCVPEARMPDRTLFSCVEEVRGWYEDDVLCMAAPGVHIRSRPAEGWARLTIGRACVEAKPRLVAETLAPFLLFELLRHRGLYHLHGAALVRGDRGLIIAGPTRSGKTTTAVSLIRRGFACVADDDLFVQATDGSVLVYGLPEEFTLAPTAAELFPELSFLTRRPPCGDGEKRSFDPQQVYGAAFAEKCAPRVLVFSSSSGGARTALTPLSSTEAFVRAVPLSLLIALDRSIAADHAAALKHLVEGCACYALSAGQDLRREPWRLLEMLGMDTP